MSPKSRKQNEQIRQEKKTLIMDTALELFAENGFHATSISQIAQKAGISKGLMYNYFASKENLLAELYETISMEVMEMINPNHDEMISMEEMSSFFDLFFKSLQEKRTSWKLYFQLSMQPKVIELISSRGVMEKAMKNRQVLLSFFVHHHPENPFNEMLLFSSVIKGFTIQYVFAPEHFSESILNDFKARIARLFLTNSSTEKSLQP